MKISGLSLLVVAALVGLAGCREPTISEGILPVRVITETDANGGNWRTIVLKSATDVTVPQPAAVQSDEYQRELTAARNGVAGATPEQLTAAVYWSEGGMLRWNQMARQLVAKYNVTPTYDAQTGQIVPVDTRPLASAPFAARLYALLSVAQYDALVVAWRAKYQYNRPALEQQNVAVRVPVLDVPSYPSEDAVIAEASYQILAYFFPNEADWLKERATEHKQSRVWAGANVPSDIKAGENLAAAVAAKVISYANTDRFRLAHDPGNTWSALRSRASYDVTWQSLEKPARAPLLPLAGSVRTWFDSTAVFRNRPPAPPLTSSDIFQKDLAETRQLADARDREQWRVADFWSDGIGTYNAPGHWNLIAEDLIRQGQYNELRTARTCALLNRAMHDAITVGWQAKYQYFVPRPSQMDPALKVSVYIPNTPAYVAEQATFAGAAATVLSYVFPDQATTLNAQAAEAAMAQRYAGVHYRFDTEAGTQCGNGVGKVAVDWARADGVK